jgi:pimeloyl-ACP methyl ester carboxylesterase
VNRTVTLDTGEFAYREAGPPDGTPAVMLHGLGSKAATWDRIATGLAGRGTARWLSTSAGTAARRARPATRSSRCATTSPGSPTRCGWASSS